MKYFEKQQLLNIIKIGRHSSKTLLPEPFTGSNDFENYITHFEFLSQPQKWQRKERVNGAETEIDERQHYFALRLQKWAVDFYRTLSEDTRRSYDETLKAFRQHYNEKPVVFRGRLARRVQQPGEKLTDFLGDLQTLALKAYPQESNEIREHLILGGFLECIENSQVPLHLRKNLGDADMTLDNTLERALHTEAVTRIEEEDNEPRVSAIQSKENTQLGNSINELVRTLQTNQPNRQENQKFSSHGARPKEFLRGNERSSRENGDRNRSTSSYTRSSAEHRRNNYESRARSLTLGGENRSRDRSHESRAKQSKAAVSFEKEKCRRCSQQNHASGECKNRFECGSPNHFIQNCPYLNEN